MNIFYGAAIQGGRDGEEKADVNNEFIACIKEQGHHVCTEHTTGKNHKETLEILEKSIGPFPKGEEERKIYVRRKMVSLVDDKETKAAIFEVSLPSTGTGVEITHAYTRGERGLPEIPILMLYEKDFWPRGLSTMVKVLPTDYPNVVLFEYENLEQAKEKIKEFLEHAN